MTQKDSGPKARLPRGFADRSAADIRASEQMIARIRRVYERYGFQAVETPLIEYTDALGKFLPDLDRPNEGVFSFRDEDAQEARSAGGATGTQGEWLSLRYDLTAPLARTVAENYDKLPKPYRTYRFGWVFRNEKPGPGRFRQFMQFDADTVGSASPAADAEMCMMAADALEELGIPRGQYVIKVNSRKVLDSQMDLAQVPVERRLHVLRNIDKKDRLGTKAVWELNAGGHRDISGDFTVGAGLTDYANTIVTTTSTATGTILSSKGDRLIVTPEAQTIVVIETKSTILQSDSRITKTGDSIEIELPVESRDIIRAAQQEVRDIEALVRRAGFGSERIRIDPSVVRGLEYYTGAVFEAELLAQIPNEKGEPVVFGSVGGGGRYDGLVGRFLGEDVPATGFSIGVSRLQAALTALGKLGASEVAGPVVVLVLDRERMGDYQAMVASLRRAEIPAEMYLGAAKLGAQMKYADRRNAPLAIIQGADEKARGVVQIKDLAAGKKAAAGIADNEQWRAERPGQIEVREDGLVEAVNRLLGRGERRDP